MAMDREELIEKATKMNIEFKKNTSNANLQLLIDEAEQVQANKAIEDRASKAQVASPEASKAIKKEVKKVSGVRESTQMVKVNITALDPRMREIPSEMFTHMGRFGTKKQVVKFGKPMLVYKVIVDMLKEKQSLQQVKTVTANGKEEVDLIMSPAFMIQEIPLTDEELEEIKSK